MPKKTEQPRRRDVACKNCGWQTRHVLVYRGRRIEVWECASCEEALVEIHVPGR